MDRENRDIEPRIRIIFEDSEILILDKPSGLIVNRSDTTKEEKTVQEWVEKKFKVQSSKFKVDERSDFFNRSGIVHRLDKETSGVLIVSKTLQAFENLQRQFKERRVKKVYIALVRGRIVPEEGEIKVPVGRLPWNRKRFGVVAGGREAVTKYKAIRYFEVGNEKWDLESLIPIESGLTSRNQDIKSSSSRKSHLTLLEIYPQTGRTHQIRVHLKYFGHPVFSDPLYGGRKQARNDRKILPRLFLHAAKISFAHPKTGEQVTFESPLPKELEEIMSQLKVKS